MEEWKKDITGLAEIASSEPQLAYAAFVYGTSKRWNFLARTTPEISHLLYKLEYHIKDTFIPKILGKLYVPDSLRDIFSLPARMGGLGISNICETADLEYKHSVMATEKLVDAIYHQINTYSSDDDHRKEVADKIRASKEEFYKTTKEKLLSENAASVCRELELLYIGCIPVCPRALVSNFFETGHTHSKETWHTYTCAKFSQRNYNYLVVQVDLSRVIRGRGISWC